MNQVPALSARFGDRFHRLPDGAEALAAAPLIRPLPGASPPLLGLIALRGRLLPALVPAAGDQLDLPALGWIHLPAPASLVIGVRDVRPAEPDDPVLPEVLLATSPGTPAAPVLARGPEMSGPAAATPRADASTRESSGVLRLTLGAGVHADLPAERVVRVVPAQPMSPVPGRTAGALGYVNTPAGDAIVLDPVWLLNVEPRESYPLLVLFEMSGRRLARPCDRVAPAPRGTPLFAQTARVMPIPPE